MPVDGFRPSHYSPRMIAERLPELAAMPVAEKWLVLNELKEELCDEHRDLSESAEGKAAIKELLDYRWRQFQADPSIATTWEAVREKMHASRRQRLATAA